MYSLFPLLVNGHFFDLSFLVFFYESSWGVGMAILRPRSNGLM